MLFFPAQLRDTFVAARLPCRGAMTILLLLLILFNDRTNAFVFGTNPYGVLREALLSNGCRDFDTDWDDSWDNKWYGASKVHDDHWACEIAIPFTTLRFKEGTTEWRFNSYRFDTQTNTRTVWNRIPQNQLIANLAFTGRFFLKNR